MQKDIIINVSEYETRLAILEDTKLVELLVQRPDSERMVGDIYKGVVRAVLPGMQAAFIDIGLEKSAFLHFSDMRDSKSQLDLLYEADFLEEEGAKRTKKLPESIQEVLKEGQEILVQITKEPIGTKGPRVTNQLSLPGRYVVLVPGEDHVGVSRKISDWKEKRRLKRLTYEVKPDGFGCIIRTVAEGKEKNEIKSDIKSLAKLWKGIKKLAEKKPAPVLVHKDIGLVSSTMRDILTLEVNNVIVDSKGEYKQILSYLKSIAAKTLRSKVNLYEGRVPIFDAYNIEPEIEKMLDRKVWVKKGAYFVIDQTEAMVTIDVNTGRFVGKTTQESTVLKTNMEAAREIARQIRLRDIGGLIIVDFIDMESSENRRKVFEEFKTAFRHDRSKNSILPISEFGLVEMTRERVRPSILHTLSETCPCCGGIGRVVSKETQAMKIERWFKRARVGSKCKNYRLMVHPDAAAILEDGKAGRIRKLSKQLGLNIELVKEEDLHFSQFKVFDLDQKMEVTDLFKAKK
ncbi:MAG: Rne/Rng family ribonuclease [Candidatus Zixiibacteriota bacterium]